MVTVISAGNVMRRIPRECRGGLILILIKPTLTKGSGIISPLVLERSSCLFALGSSSLVMFIARTRSLFPLISLTDLVVESRRINLRFASCFVYEQ